MFSSIIFFVALCALLWLLLVGWVATELRLRESRIPHYQQVAMVVFGPCTIIVYLIVQTVRTLAYCAYMVYMMVMGKEGQNELT